MGFAYFAFFIQMHNNENRCASSLIIILKKSLLQALITAIKVTVLDIFVFKKHFLATFKILLL